MDATIDQLATCTSASKLETPAPVAILDMLAALAAESKAPTASIPKQSTSFSHLQEIPTARVTQITQVSAANLQLIESKPVDSSMQLSSSAPIMFHTIAHKPKQGSMSVITYRCGYCGVRKTSTSAGGDGRVRIRCECGGKRRDGKPRMHAMWHPCHTVIDDTVEPRAKRAKAPAVEQLHLMPVILPALVQKHDLGCLDHQLTVMTPRSPAKSVPRSTTESQNTAVVALKTEEQEMPPKSTETAAHLMPAHPMPAQPLATQPLAAV